MKGDTCGNDWYEINLNSCERNSNENHFSNKSFLEYCFSESYHLITGVPTRNGAYDYDDIFLVYEKEDLELLIKTLQQAIPLDKVRKRFTQSLTDLIVTGHADFEFHNECDATALRSYAERLKRDL